MSSTLFDSRVERKAGHEELRVYRLAYQAAMRIFELSKQFPADERYSLTDQIRRSSRSVVANIAEGFRKRQYIKMFSSKMADADGEASETQVWINFAFDCGYLSREQFVDLVGTYQEIGKMLGTMVLRPEKFLPRR